MNQDFLAQYFVERLFNDIYCNEQLCDVVNDIKDAVLLSPYNKVLDIIEGVCKILFESKDDYFNRTYDYTCNKYLSTFEYFNQIFENEYIGYRFVNNEIISVSTKDEAKSIENASNTEYQKINEHIRKASNMLSQNGAKDCKNSVKESITALETLLNIALGKTGITLGKAAEEYFQNQTAHDELKEAIKHLYKYTSDFEGIRHGNNKANGDVMFNEAMFVLVSCSALINYIINIESEKGNH
jgi:hypothetical protein